ncbi:MAG: alpha/beta hydrolase, partial [Firmicutes bacterium]|nr:alpha/beta hydrolase [Bacillota bacterium]
MDRTGKAALITLGAIGGAAMGMSYFLARAVARPAQKSFEYRVSDLREHGRWEDYDKLKKVPYMVEMPDGYMLHATFIPAGTESDRYVIISHGFGDNRLGSAKYALMYHAMGFNSIIYDTRGMGENENQPITLGLKESKDLIRLIVDTRKRYGSGITLGLHGESMGAAFQILALQYMPKVSFMICDCGFAKLNDVLNLQITKIYHLPSWMVKLGSFGSRILYGYFFGEVQPIKALKFGKVPICFCHGTSDGLI